MGMWVYYHILTSWWTALYRDTNSYYLLFIGIVWSMRTFSEIQQALGLKRRGSW